MDQQASSTLPASASKPNAACNRCRGKASHGTLRYTALTLSKARSYAVFEYKALTDVHAATVLMHHASFQRPGQWVGRHEENIVKARSRSKRMVRMGGTLRTMLVGKMTLRSKSTNIVHCNHTFADQHRNDAVDDKAFPLVEDQIQKILQLSELHMGIHHFQLRIQRLGKARNTLSTPEAEVVHLTGSDVGQMLAYLTDLETLAIKLHLLPTPSKCMDRPLFHLALSSYARLHQVIPLVVDQLTTPSDAAPLQLETAGNLGATLRVGDFAVAMDAELQRSLVIQLCEQNLGIVEQRMKASSGT